MDTSITTASLLRLVGFMAMGVGAAWALQILGVDDATGFGRLMWVVAAASVAGGGAGLIYTSGAIDTAGAPAKA